MRILKELFDNNKAWAARKNEENAEFFSKLAQGQAPPYLWIGCADSRVPANEIIGLDPGEVFVHRNVANVVVHTDFNCLSVLQYAVEVLKVEHVIVCGHYGCGGVAAAMQDQPYGLIDNWLRHIRDVYEHSELGPDDGLDPKTRHDKLCELNVAAQVHNVCHTTIVQDAWRRGQNLAVHGWIYALTDGLLRDLDLCISSPEHLSKTFRMKPSPRAS